MESLTENSLILVISTRVVCRGGKSWGELVWLVDVGIFHTFQRKLVTVGTNHTPLNVYVKRIPNYKEMRTSFLVQYYTIWSMDLLVLALGCVPGILAVDVSFLKMLLPDR